MYIEIITGEDIACEFQGHPNTELYIYITGNEIERQQEGRFSLLVQWYAAKFTFLDAPRNTRCNAILKNILSLTK